MKALAPMKTLALTLLAALAASTTLSAAGEHGLSQSAVEIWRPFGFPVTNSMVVTWIVAIGLIVFAQVATRHMREVPDGAQNFLEWLVESLYNFLKICSAHTWRSRRSGFLRRSLSSSSPPTGWAWFPVSVRWAGAITRRKDFNSKNRSSAAPMPTST
jgi:hypothetical protein